MGHKIGTRQEGGEDAAAVHQQQNAKQKNVIKMCSKKGLTWATRLAPARKVEDAAALHHQPDSKKRISSKCVLKRDQHRHQGGVRSHTPAAEC